MDSVAEKLATVYSEVPFFVIGHAKNLGATSANWTLGAQVER